MSNLKRNYIKLINNPEKVQNDNAEPQFETFITPHFIPFRLIYSSMDALATADDPNTSESEALDELMNMVTEIYNNQFNREDILDRLHSPDALEELRGQVEFVAQGKMEEERKKELKALLK